MPTLLDLTWKPCAGEQTLPTDLTPPVGPAVYRNDGYSLHFVLLDGEDPYVPEGTLTAQIRRLRLGASAVPGEPLAEFDVTQVSNDVTLALTAAQTAALPNDAYWDLQESFDDADPRTWFTGRVKCWGDITRETGS